MKKEKQLYVNRSIFAGVKEFTTGGGETLRAENDSFNGKGDIWNIYKEIGDAFHFQTKIRCKSRNCYKIYEAYINATAHCDEESEEDEEYED